MKIFISWTFKTTFLMRCLVKRMEEQAWASEWKRKSAILKTERKKTEQKVEGKPAGRVNVNVIWKTFPLTECAVQILSHAHKNMLNYLYHPHNPLLIVYIEWAGWSGRREGASLPGECQLAFPCLTDKNKTKQVKPKGDSFTHPIGWHVWALLTPPNSFWRSVL